MSGEPEQRRAEFNEWMARDVVQYIDALKSSLRAVEAERDELTEMYTRQGLSAFKPYAEQKARAEAAESREKQVRAETIEECEVAAWEYLHREFPKQNELRNEVIWAIQKLRALASKEGGNG